jgi:nonsense-mediated mRNA decay protein 3
MSFCVKCGAEGPVYESVCERCFLESRQFTKVADHVDLPQCAHCKDYSMDGKWVSQPAVEAAVEEAAIQAVQVMEGAQVLEVGAEVIEADKLNFRVNMQLAVEYKGLRVEEERDTIVRVKGSVCGRCSKIKGSYFESTLQIRSRDRKLTESEVDAILDRVQSMVEEMAAENREVFISKLDRVVGGAGGADVYLSSNSAGKVISRNLADQYGAEVKDTAKLLTKREGKDVYRVTYLVRLPAYRYGDVVMFRKRMFQVGATRTSNAKLTDMRTGESLMFSHGDLQDAKVIGMKDEMLDAVVLTETDKEVQILHPTTMRPIELRKPPRFEVKKDTVKVFVHDEEIFLLPK